MRREKRGRIEFDLKAPKELRAARLQLREGDLQRGFGLLARDSGPQPSHHVQPRRATLAEQIFLRVELVSHQQRRPDIRRFSFSPDKARFGHADYSERMSV